ncbi:CDP-glycerol glycerophosphotransferase family protein [Streptomyces sp. NPDC058576]|uniref:bifunctional glycosyltransferase/CDP-glycerol:glycerophosphate glycerophosphotransferase n=1 Tax=Streptomyces sp. NPDC058576 TaxID=3346547 RepID=UPI0036659AEE
MAPRLTVVVPLYNVEEYLGACLSSLAEQTMPDLEVVLVDDGSTDDGPALAQEFADRDPRFRLLRQENAGLGAARNAGVRAAHPDAEFLTFVDSDDVVPPGAFARMLTELDRSGSDFATGNVLRLRANGDLEQSPMFRKPMEKARRATHVTRDWILLGDRIACNKVFRRTFWDEHAFAFPTGVLYEDIAVVLPAHFLARSVDVVEEPVYHWRDRDGSITTRRAVPRGIRDRVTAVTTVSRFLADRPRTEGAAEAQRRYDAHALSGDLWLFIEALPDGDTEFHEAFLEHAGAFAATVEPDVLASLPLHLRVKWQLIRERRLPELLALLADEKKDRDTFHVTGLLRPRAQHPAVRDPLPPATTALTPADLPVHAHLTEAVWRDGQLRLTGYAYVRNAPGGSPRLGWLRSGKRLIPLRLRPVDGDEATARSGRSLHRYDRAGFEAVVDPRAIARRGNGGRTTWKLEAVVIGAGRPRRGPMRLVGTPAPPAVTYTDERTRVVPVLSGNKLELRTERVAAVLTGQSAVEDTTVRLDVKILGDAGPVALRLTEWRTKETREFALRGSLGSRAADIPLSAFRGEDDIWGVQLVGEGQPLTVAARTDGQDGRYALPGGRELYAAPNPSGDLVLTDRPVQPVVASVAWEEPGELTLEGSFPEPTGTARELVLRHSGHQEEVVVEVERGEGDGFRAVIAPAAVEGPGGALPLAEGRWYLFLREPGERDPEAYRPLRLSISLHHLLPLRQQSVGRDFTLQRRHHDRLVLESGSALPAAERGPYGQRVQRERYADQRASTAELRPAVLYSSFDGRQHSDSPRAIHRELAARGRDIEHLWVVRDQQAAVPEGVTAVALHSAAWYEALARSRWIVTNTHLPHWFERAEGQCVVQTWHGTPLKRIGRDLAGSPHADAAYMASMERRSAQWSVLVSPNSFSTPVLRRAFGYSGEVLECGYPRNDLLYETDRAKVAAAVRERLAIPEGRRVILYAPTWREDQPRKGGRYAPDLHLDLEHARDALGDDHVLLVRRHYLVGGTVPDTDFVRDVSRHPDVTELLLISDVLVTDYSSIMFDFAQTGRPMLFHTYDLAHYRDTLRGFCFDFERRAPGPLIPESAGIVAALRDPVAATAGHREAYERFREAFCDLDDGTAAAGVVDRMLKGDPTPPGDRATEGDRPVEGERA